MKFLLSVILIALLSLAACFYLPWWIIAVVAFIVSALVPQKPLPSFFSGFTALFILWFALSAWISTANGNVLAPKMSLLILGIANPLLLFLLTAFIGGLVGGMGALTGSFFRKKST